jgi:CubicO group peptidase (beta-lactamase class C family)
MKSIKNLQPVAAFILSLVLSLSFSCNSTPETIAGLSVDSLNQADVKMKAYVDDGKLPCVATVIIKDGKKIHQNIYGHAHIGEEKMLEEDAIFRIYSMSKPITAAALMILYDEGKFQLDDPVANYIPEFAETKVWVDGEEVAQQEPFTIRHLLTHTAGFCYGSDVSHVDSLYAQASPEGFWSIVSLEEMIKLLAQIPLKNQPGTKYEYSVSIDVVGYLAEVLSGKPFDEFLQTQLFEPLGMVDTGFEVPEEDQDRLTMIYTFDKEMDTLKPVEDLTNEVKQKVTLFSGGGGLVSTLADYGRFGQMLLNGGELDGVRVLQESTVKLIMSDQMPSAVNFRDGARYGLGGYVNTSTAEYGWSGMASTDFVADPRNNMIILSFTQYIPFMEIPYAAEYKDLVRNALVEKETSD